MQASSSPPRVAAGDVVRVPVTADLVQGRAVGIVRKVLVQGAPDRVVVGVDIGPGFLLPDDARDAAEPSVLEWVPAEGVTLLGHRVSSVEGQLAPAAAASADGDGASAVGSAAGATPPPRGRKVVSFESPPRGAPPTRSGSEGARDSLSPAASPRRSSARRRTPRGAEALLRAAGDPVIALLHGHSAPHSFIFAILTGLLLGLGQLQQRAHTLPPQTPLWLPLLYLQPMRLAEALIRAVLALVLLSTPRLHRAERATTKFMLCAVAVAAAAAAAFPAQFLMSVPPCDAAAGALAALSLLTTASGVFFAGTS